jgi:phosphatidylglycerol:prolipoprotein diacylglycerol transferase
MPAVGELALMELPASVDLHAIYIALMLLALLLTITNPVTKHFPDRRSRRRYYTLQAITAISAVFGAKLAVLMGDALWPLQGFTQWDALMSSGRSIAGALLFGFLGAEAAKPLLNYDIPPNDRFAIILPFSIGIGRVGCLIAGCCRGTAWDGPVAIAYSDGVLRHPAQAYEIVFHISMGLVLRALWRRQILFGRLFALYLAAYGVFRYFTEFLRETPKAFAGLSAYQWLALAMIAAGAIAIAARTMHQPRSWDQWRAAARQS